MNCHSFICRLTCTELYVCIYIYHVFAFIGIYINSYLRLFTLKKNKLINIKDNSYLVHYINKYLYEKK